MPRPPIGLLRTTAGRRALLLTFLERAGQFRQLPLASTVESASATTGNETLDTSLA